MYKRSTPQMVIKRRSPKILYNLRLYMGLCPACGHKREPEDNILCTQCKTKHNRNGKKYSKNHKEARAKSQRKLRKKRLKSGLCAYCGRPRDNGFKMCTQCRASKRYKWHNNLQHRVRNKGYPTHD